MQDDRPTARTGDVTQLVVVVGHDRTAVTPSRHLLAGVDEVAIGRGARAAQRDPRRRLLTLRLSDRAMSSAHARLLRVRDRWVLEDAGAKNGVQVNGATVKRAVLLDGDVVEMGSTVFMVRVAPPAHDAIPDLFADGQPVAGLGLPTFNADLATTLDGLARVAGTLIPVVVSGASGTGKEVVARALHAASRRVGPFVAVNCGALPSGLVESILFGHRRGAFSGADQHQPGLIRSAKDGTLFLDELADLPAPAQVALLRVLQDSEVLGVGEMRPQHVDVRVVAAIQRPLAELVDEGRLRADLAARLGGMVVRLPRLAERREDLGLLIEALLPPGARLSLGATRELLHYPWPMNVRELEKALAVAAVLAAGETIRVDHLPEAVRAPAPDEGDATDERLRTELVALLTAHQGNIAEVARIMGKARTQVHRWVKRFGVELDSFRR